MKSRFRFEALFALLVLVAMALGACTPGQEGGEPPAPPSGEGDKIGVGHSVAVVFAYGGLGDKSFNDSLFTGMVLASDEFGFAWDYVEPMAAAEYEPFLRAYAQTGSYDLIICNGFSCGSSLDAVAPDFPDQKFMIIDGVVEHPNVSYYGFAIHEVGYLVGVVAGLTTESNTIGFVGAFDIPIVEVGAAGLKSGALSVNPDVNVLIGYVGAWDDVAACKEMAISQFNQGADLVYHNSSLGGLGVIEAGKEYGFLTVGFDGNQNVLAPETNFLSAIRAFPEAARDSIESVLLGEFVPGAHNLGVKEGAVYITNELSSVAIDDSVWAAVADAEAGISSGEIVVPQTLAEIE